MERETIIDKIKQLFGFIKIQEQNFYFVNKIKSTRYDIPMDIKSFERDKIPIEIKEKTSDFLIKIKKNSINTNSIIIKDSSLSNKKTDIKNINLNFLQEKPAYEFKFGFEYPIVKDIVIMEKSKLIRKISVNNIPIIMRKNIGVFKVVQLNHNIALIAATNLIRRFPVKRKARFVVWTRELQLKIWKQIIEYTKKRPMELEFIAIFSNIPIKITNDIKINYKKKELLFSIKEKNDKLYNDTKDIVIVKGKADNKTWVVPLSIKGEI